VAEPEIQYDPEEAEGRLWRQPLRWLKRNVDLFVPLTAFIGRVLMDIQTQLEEKVREEEAVEVRRIRCSGCLEQPVFGDVV